MIELYQDTLVDLLLPTKNAKRLKLEVKKDSKVFCRFVYYRGHFEQTIKSTADLLC